MQLIKTPSNTANENEAENIELNKDIPKGKYIALEKRLKIIDELRLVNYINKMKY